MTKQKITPMLSIIVLALSITLTACSQEGGYMTDNAMRRARSVDASDMYTAEAYMGETFAEMNTEEYSEIKESGFKSPRTEPLSTFSADVDTASYTNIRRYINNGDTVPAGAVRIEEMLNYFSYDYPEPESGKAFSTTVEIGGCPWNENTKLMKIGLQTAKIDVSQMPPSNLVFLIDSSGSMYSSNKLPLLKQAFSLVIENMSENDKISIVTYASSNDTLIDGGRIHDKDRILDILTSLEAAGSTNGSGGIETAYKIAEKIT